MQIAWNKHFGSPVGVARVDFDEIIAFHSGLPGYIPTPLIAPGATAARLGLASLYIKDEASRFGLQSFKPLGVSWAVEQITRKNRQRHHIFATATDGNHGRGLAWAAAIAGHKAVIHMPSGSSQARVEAIRNLGARCVVTDLNYDDTVAELSALAKRSGWTVVQDTAWPGYEEIPAWIMQGYGTLIGEIVAQLAGRPQPTHVFLQAGVGSFAAGVIEAIRMQTAWDPVFVIIEPAAASCIFDSIQAGDMRRAEGSLTTIMAGLACGIPSSIAWPVIRANACAALKGPDAMAEEGMRFLYHDCGIVAGESGAATAGALALLMRSNAFGEWRERLGLDSRARVLLISTEGATDFAAWQAIMGAAGACC